MLSSKPTTLENLAKLSENEKSVLNEMVRLLTSPESNAAAKQLVVKTLTTYPLRLLYAFSVNNNVINDLLENDPTLNRAWISYLQTLHYPYHKIVACDQSQKISVFTQLKGAFLLSELSKYPQLTDRAALIILNKACELGMYHALIKRLNFFCGMLAKSDSNNTDAAKTYLPVILKDAAKLSNLYWTMGSIDATLILFNTLNKMFELSTQKISIERFFFSAKSNQFSWLKKYDHTDKPYPIALLEVAVENLYLARLLHDMPASQLITTQLSRMDNAFEGFEEEFTNYNDLQKLVMKKMHSLNVPLVSTFCQVAFNHAINRMHELFPDYSIPKEINPTNIAVKAPKSG